MIKALVKPIANSLKQSAAEAGAFRDICHKYGQFHNNMMTRIQLRSLGHHVKTVKPLPEDEAVKLGAEVFAEGLVLFVGIAAIAAEVVRKQKADEHAKREKELKEIEERKAREVRAIQKETALRERLQALEDSIHAVESAKLAALHKDITAVESQHLKVTKALMERIEALERRLGVEVVCEVPAIPDVPQTVPTGVVFQVQPQDGIGSEIIATAVANVRTKVDDGSTEVRVTQVSPAVITSGRTAAVAGEDSATTPIPPKSASPSIPAASEQQDTHRQPSDWARPKLVPIQSQQPLLVVPPASTNPSTLDSVETKDTKTHVPVYVAPIGHSTAQTERMEAASTKAKAEQAVAQIFPNKPVH